MDGYSFATHAEAPDRDRLIAELSALDALAFSHYDGVVDATPEFLRWYTVRPGMNPRLCQGASREGRLVASVFVTLASMRLGGGEVRCGIIDTVMTHPDHRRRGLARRLMERALRGMEAEGADVSLLYTGRSEPMSGPERLYRSLGYSPREVVARMERAAQSFPAAPARSVAPDVKARQPVEQALGGRDGWLLVDDDLWRWRRVARPAQYPAVVHAAKSTSAVICAGKLISSGALRPLTVVSDIVLSRAGDAGEELASVLAAAPRDAPVTALCPESDTRLAQSLGGLGFTATGLEVAMLCPISERGRQALAAPAVGWYVATESLIGV
jgi:GNAT superfamily N-acetyltransferase